MFMVNKDYDT